MFSPPPLPFVVPISYALGPTPGQLETPKCSIDVCRTPLVGVRPGLLATILAPVGTIDAVRRELDRVTVRVENLRAVSLAPMVGPPFDQAAADFSSLANCIKQRKGWIRLTFLPHEPSQCLSRRDRCGRCLPGSFATRRL